MTYRKKLIEVALPLEAINMASAREKSIRQGHPSTLHIWWARRPLAAARAVIFAQIIDDPSEYVEELMIDPNKRTEAENVYKSRIKIWEDRIKLYKKNPTTEIPNKSNSEPNPHPTLEETVAEIERQRLFTILENLVLWENSTNEIVLKSAREEILKSWQRTCKDNARHPEAKALFDHQKIPAFHDPFAGGGALPLEAQRLGLISYASDINPVAVLINKAMIEIPPRFANQPPINPEFLSQKMLLTLDWKGAQGIAEDVRYYGQWVREEAERRIGYLYPKAEINPEMAAERPDLKKHIGQKLTVIAWIWARTVKSPNPVFSNVQVPLAATFMLSSNEGKEVYVEPLIREGGYDFKVKVGKPKDNDKTKKGTKLARGANFQCLMSGTPIESDYIKTEGQAGRLGARLMATVVDSEHGRIYLSPTSEMEAVAQKAKPLWEPEGSFVEDARAFTPYLYGIKEWRHLFTSRQLVALTTFCDLIQEVRDQVRRDAIASGIEDDCVSLDDGGSLATAYSDAIAVYLSFAVSKIADRNSAMTTWASNREHASNTFKRQALSMTWDFAECNVFSQSSGNFDGGILSIYKALQSLGFASIGSSTLSDASVQTISVGKIVSTDPPYYDNVPYADLSDFFYVWLRHALKPFFPNLFATLAVPKVEELVATSYRHGGNKKAEEFFLDGMTQAMNRLAEQSHPGFPVTIYYAFKQAENDSTDGTVSTGWEIFLDAVIKAGFSITGTWPIHTELERRMRGRESNALASSIVLICRKQNTNAPIATRREFIISLQKELPIALVILQGGNIAPVDLAQAAIGPGMAVYTSYAKVIDAEGKSITVRQALALINQTLDEVLAEQEGDFDADTRWALDWFEQFGFNEGEYGDAETLSRAKDTSVAGMVNAGIISSGRGKVHLLKPTEFSIDWDPTLDSRLTTWEMVHQLIRVLEKGGESEAAMLMTKLGTKAETARELCYRLYSVCERKKRNAEALSYNGLVQSWPEISRLARENYEQTEIQQNLF